MKINVTVLSRAYKIVVSTSRLRKVAAERTQFAKDNEWRFADPWQEL